MDKENLTNQQSLEIISKMITTAKGNVCQGSIHMILWGWVVSIISISHFLFLKFEIINHPEMLWLLTIPTAGASMYIGFSRGKKAKVTTYLDRLYMWVWMAFMFTMVLMFFIVFGRWEIVNPMVLALSGYATFLSGTIIKYKPMIYGAISLWLWAVVAYYAGPYYGLLVIAAALITGYLIPGYMLQRKSNES